MEHSILQIREPASQREFVEHVAIGDSMGESIRFGQSIDHEQLRRNPDLRRNLNPVMRRAERMAVDRKYYDETLENIRLVADFYSGRRSLRDFQAAMTVDDFDSIYTQTLDHQVIMGYERYEQVWRNFMYVHEVQDFRTAQISNLYGMASGLWKVGEGADYREDNIDDRDVTFDVAKYGKVYPFTWEMMVNDNLRAFQSLPMVMAEDAAMSLQEFASSLYVANTTLFTGSNKFDLALNLTNLITAWETMAGFTDDASGDNRPVMNSPNFLVVPPQREATAIQMTTAIQPDQAGNVNPVGTRLRVLVDPWIPLLDTTTGSASWYLLRQSTARAFIAIVAMLRGHTLPQVFRTVATGQSLAGGNSSPDMSFTDDTVKFKVRLVYGGVHANALGMNIYGAWSDGS